LGIKHLDRDSAVLRLLVAGLFGGSLLGANQGFAQTSSPTQSVGDDGLWLRSSEDLPDLRPARNTNPPKTVPDRGAFLRLRLSPALGLLATAGMAPASRRGGRAEAGAGDTPALLAESDDDDAPYDPTVPGPRPSALPARPAARRAPAAPGTSATTGISGAAQDKEAASVLGWSFAPVRWGGQLGLFTRRNSSGGGAQSSDIQEYLNLRAASYIYQPWFAQVNGNLQLASNQGSSSAGSGSGGTESKQEGKSITGGGTVRLFPVSRFPFQANFDVSDSRSSSDVITTDYTNTRFGFRQSYRPEDGAYALTGGYDASTITSNSFGKDSVGTVFGNFSRNTDVQSIQASGNYSQSTRSLTGDASRLISFDSRHSYQLEENISYDSLATITDNTLSYSTPSGIVNNHGRYMQFNSSLTWRPEDEEIPLFVTGGMRTLSALNESVGNSSTSQSMGLNLSATYAPSANLSFNGNGLVTRLASSSAGSQVLTLLGGGAVYTGNPLNIGNFSYNWNAGANGSQQSGTGGQGGNGTSSNTSLTGQLNHNLNRAINASDNSSWYFTLGQSLAETSSTQIGNTTSLTNSAGVSYRTMFGEAYGGTASFNANDMRTSGANAGHFRYFNLQLNGQAQFSQRSAGSVNLTFQWSAQDLPQVQDNTVFASSPQNTTQSSSRNSAMNIFGSAVYQHQRVFGMPGLRYTMSFNANTLARDERMAGDVNGSVDRLTYSVDNRFDYRVGLLDFQLKGMVTESAGKKNALIFFKATRDFGRY